VRLPVEQHHRGVERAAAEVEHEGRARLRDLLLESIRRRDRLLVELAALRGTATVRLREWLLRSPVLGRPTRFVARLAKGRVYS